MTSNKTNDNNYAEKILKEIGEKEAKKPEYYDENSSRFESNNDSARRYAESVARTIAWHF